MTSNDLTLSINLNNMLTNKMECGIYLLMKCLTTNLTQIMMIKLSSCFFLAWKYTFDMAGRKLTIIFPKPSWCRFRLPLVSFRLIKSLKSYCCLLEDGLVCCSINNSNEGFLLLFCIWVDGKLASGAESHYEICCSFPQNVHTLHALESSIFIRFLFRLLRSSDLYEIWNLCS